VSTALASREREREGAPPVVLLGGPAATPTRSARALQALGEGLRRHQRLVVLAQWVMVGVYAVLVVLPPLLPDPAVAARLARLSELLIWGLWWPGVVLTTMLFGQLWCGLLCPDGILTEAVSRRGLNWKIGDRLAWPVWPLTLFVGLTLYDHVVDAHRAPRSALVVLGLSSLAAVAFGALHASGRRAWCRFLCPVGSVFSLLARCAVLHFRVDRAAWDAAPRRASRAVDCPPMLDVRRLASNEKCNMCGRCSGHRGAVSLAARPLDSELLALDDQEVRTWEALGIVFVLIGLLYAVAHWRAAGWAGPVAAALRGGLLDRTAPWWIAGSAAGPVTCAEGLAALAVMLGATFALGGATWLALWAGALGDVRRASRLAYALIPLGGTVVLVAALEHAAGLFAVAGVFPALRLVLLATGVFRSLRVGVSLAAPELRPLSRGLLRAGLALAVVVVTAAAALAPVPPAS
jgi:hypothetical protein